MKSVLLMLFVFLLCNHSYGQKQDWNADSVKIYTTPVEIMPTYKGGEDRLNFRLQHIRYLFIDRMHNIEGKVLVSFVVEKNGSVSNVKMLRGMTQEQDNEVIRVVKNLRKWNPGMHDGKPVRVQYTLPIDFKLIKT